MKKILLTIAGLALGAIASQATSYTVFDNSDGMGTWTGDENGYTHTTTIDGATFEVCTEKGDYKDIMQDPNNPTNGAAWKSLRIYKNSDLAIKSSIDVKTVVITFDEYDSNKYVGEMVLGTGWSGTLDGVTYTVVSSTGAKSVTLRAAEKQLRIKKIVVSTEAGEVPDDPQPPVTPSDPTDGVTVFDITSPGSWTGDANGYTSTRNVDGYEFTLTSAKASSTTDLIAPDANSYSWRVYKGSTVTIDSKNLDMKTVVITFDDFEQDGKGFVSEMGLSNGWTGSLDGVTYTLSSNGEKSITLSADAQQVRIKKIVVSGEGGGITPPVVPDNQIYANDFKSSIADWTVTNDIDNGLAGWKINNNDPKCAIANSYNGGTKENMEASAWLTRAFDLTDWENVELSFDQAFGYTFPQTQPDYATVNVREEGGDWETLTLANYPEVPEKSWTKFVNNTLDLSAYDGLKIEIGFHYTNDGKQSIVWELQNFLLTGDNIGAVSEISSEDVAPVYYNLQGQRVANPEKGLFIIVKGNKAEKVIL